jgi:hypothetical protein
VDLAARGRSRTGRVGRRGGATLPPGLASYALAQACAADEWAGTHPAAVERSISVEESLLGVEEKGGMISAFPVPRHQGLASR